MSNLIRGLSENGGVVFCGVNSTEIVRKAEQLHGVLAHDEPRQKRDAGLPRRRKRRRRVRRDAKLVSDAVYVQHDMRRQDLQERPR